MPLCMVHNLTQCCSTLISGSDRAFGPNLLTGWPSLPLRVVQYYFNALLQLKDEMSQLGERLQPPAP